MFQALKSISLTRWPWLLLTVTALLLVASGLYFQYVLNLQPCIKCIYIRAAFAGVLIAGLIGLVAPANATLRWLGIVAWFSAASFGVWQAQELVNIEQTLASGGFSTCALFANFPSWLALDKWLPSVFEVTGTCGGIDWQFLSLTMAEWSRLLLLGYSIIALLVAASQFVRLNKNPYM